MHKQAFNGGCLGLEARKHINVETLKWKIQKTCCYGCIIPLVLREQQGRFRVLAPVEGQAERQQEDEERPELFVVAEKACDPVRAEVTLRPEAGPPPRRPGGARGSPARFAG